MKVISSIQKSFWGVGVKREAEILSQWELGPVDRELASEYASLDGGGARVGLMIYAAPAREVPTMPERRTSP